jgi:hypothetical protein
MPYRAGFLATLVWVGLAISACAQSEVDEPDGPAIDAAKDASSIDGRIVDARMTDARIMDAQMIDARIIDAQMIDARMIDARTCATNPCDILTQCGCESTPGEPVCDLDPQMWASGGTECRAAGSGTQATTCTSSTECAAEHVCAGGRCRRYCDDHVNDCPGAGGVCIIPLTQGTPATPIPNAPLTCTTDCMPSNETNATCPTSWACHAYRNEVNGVAQYISECDLPGSGITGSPCASNRDCAPGRDCITFSNGAKQCRPMCLCNGSDCTTGQCLSRNETCHAFSPLLTIGTQTYGTCY